MDIASYKLYFKSVLFFFCFAHSVLLFPSLSVFNARLANFKEVWKEYRGITVGLYFMM